MALIDCALLLDLHGMLGVDIHDNLLPPPVGPVPPTVPHAVFQALGLISFTAQKTNIPPNVSAWTRPIILRGSDIGPLIPHIPIPPMPNIKLLTIIPGSGSKSEFGCFTVHAKGKPVATAFPAVYGTLNLNCQGPTTVPLPLLTGIVVAPNTVFAGMSLGDIIASVISLYIDIILQAIMYFVWGKYGDLVGQAAWGKMAEILADTGLGREIIGDVTGMLFSMLLYGSPVGFSGSWTPVSGLTDFKDDQLQSVADYFNDPSTESH